MQGAPTKISCKRCQRRKLKCSRTTPACANCARAGQECLYPTEDGRKKQASKHYVASLERQVAALEASLRQVQQQQQQQQQQASRSSDEADHAPAVVLGGDAAPLAVRGGGLRAGKLLIAEFSSSSSSSPPPPPQRASRPSYQGLTSIYRLGAVPGRGGDGAHARGAAPLYCAISAECPAVDEVLRSFFRWQYHEYMFIYREAFLLDYLNGAYQGRYCSPALVYAVCALGCIPAREANDAMMRRFMARAYAGLPSLDTLYVDATTVQALLSLAFCELALGNISKVWLLSGMAFRSVQDLGIHYDGSNETLGLEAEIQRRIYWGCYTSDGWIALLLGRPALFQDHDAVVRHSELLPDNTTLLSWLNDEGESNAVPPLLPYFRALSELSRTCHQLLSHVFTASTSPTTASETAVKALQRLGHALCEWHHRLPPGLRWNRWSTVAGSGADPVVTLHLYYLSLRLCTAQELSRRCAGPDAADAAAAAAAAGCEDDLVEDTARLLRQCAAARPRGGPPRPSAIMVYAAALALHSCCRGTPGPPATAPPPPQHARFLARILRQSCGCWAFADQVYAQLAPQP